MTNPSRPHELVERLREMAPEDGYHHIRCKNRTKRPGPYGACSRPECCGSCPKCSALLMWGWCGDCGYDAASADTHPKGGDVKQAPDDSLSGPAPKGDAQ